MVCASEIVPFMERQILVTSHSAIFPHITFSFICFFFIYFGALLLSE